MFFLYAAGLVILTLALVATFLEALRLRSPWLGGLAGFLVVLLFQLLLSAFESATFRIFLPVWALGPWEESLAFFNFGLYLVPVFILLNLAEQRSPWSFDLTAFLACYALTWTASLLSPGFWRSPGPDLVALFGFGSFFACLLLYLVKLLTAFRVWRTKTKKLPGMRFLLVMLVGRFFIESILNVFHDLFPPGTSEHLPPVFAIALGLGLGVLFLRRITAPWVDPRPLVAEDRVFQEWQLSPRESEVVALVCQGLHTEQVGKALFISEKTVNSHLTNIFRKAGVRTRTQLLTRIRQLQNLPSK